MGGPLTYGGLPYCMGLPKWLVLGTVVNRLGRHAQRAAEDAAIRVTPSTSKAEITLAGQQYRAEAEQRHRDWLANQEDDGKQPRVPQRRGRTTPLQRNQP